MRIVFPDKEEIKKAVLDAVKDAPLERKQIIDKTQFFYGYTEEQLQDRSCESLNTRLKSITGVVLNEMVSEEMLAVDADGRYMQPIVEEGEKERKLTRTQKRRAQRKKAADKKKTSAPKYPDTPLGLLLQESDDKLEDLKNKKINDRTYLTHLKKLAIKCISEAGGEFFEELSMKLLVSVYGGSVVKNQLTAGADDNGIDGILTICDPLGFQEKIFFQSKTKLNERAYVSIKVAREFLGVMRAYGASKGILITNSNFHRETRTFASKVDNLLLIDSNKLFELMMSHEVGVITTEGIPRLETAFFLSCK